MVSFFCTGSVKYTLDSWNQACWSLAAAASMPRSIHQQAMMVMSLAAKVSVNQCPGLVTPGVRDNGIWKSSSSKESLNGVGPCPRLILRRIFCIRLWRCGGRSCSRVSRCTCAAL